MDSEALESVLKAEVRLAGEKWYKKKYESSPPFFLVSMRPSDDE